MKRLPALLFAAVLAFSLAACGDDSDSDDSGSDSGGSSNTDSSNPDVQAYCEAVDEYVTAVQEVVDSGDAAKAADLQTQANELAEQAAGLTDITPEEAEEVADCTEKSTAALEDLANIGAP